MKIVHIADLHLGKSINEISMEEDQEYILKQILDIIKKESADAVVIAGDIYDRSIPPVNAISLFDWFLTEVKKEKCSIFCVGGNHDSGQRLDFGKIIFDKQNIFIEGKFSGNIRVIEMEDAYGKICFHMLPFFKPLQVRAYNPKLKIGDASDAMKEVLREHEVNQNVRNILITHQFVTGTDSMECSDSEMEICVGGADQISYRLFDAFDYVALGHLHGPQKAGRESIRYSGSPLKYSFSEEYHKKSVTVIEFFQKGKMEIHTVLLKPLHEMRTIRGEMKELLKPEVVALADPKDYIRAKLTDQEELLDPAAKLRDVYPNLMELMIEKNEKILKEDKMLSFKQKSPEDLMKSFLELLTGEKEEKRINYLKELFLEGRKNL